MHRRISYSLQEIETITICEWSKLYVHDNKILSITWAKLIFILISLMPSIFEFILFLSYFDWAGCLEMLARSAAGMTGYKQDQEL